MQDTPRYEAYEASRFFADGLASRHLVSGTVARGHLAEDDAVANGRNAGGYVQTSPIAVTRALLEQGRERYDVYCSPCHDRVGTGTGIVVQRGYKPPPTFHSDRLRMLPDGYLFDVVTNGFGVMPSYRAQVPVADRWAIVAYLRALQLSQHVAASELPAGERTAVENGSATPPFGGASPAQIPQDPTGREHPTAMRGRGHPPPGSTGESRPAADARGRASGSGAGARAPAAGEGDGPHG